MARRAESDTEPRARRMELSLPQVAGSAVAAVAAAVAASQLGVYGTILGAGVMSVVATCGGSVFQHFFRRTGEQIREVTVLKHPMGRRITVRTRGTADGVDACPVDRTQMLPSLDGTAPLAAGSAPERGGRGDDGRDDEFGEARTYGTRVRGWKRSALAAVVVFVVSMIGITTYELIAGNDLSGGRGTTVGSVVRGGDPDPGTVDPAPSSGTGEDGEDDRRPGDSGTASQDPGTDDDGGTPATTPEGDPSPDSGRDDGSTAGPTPAPSRSGGDTGPTGAPDPTAPGDGATGPSGPAGAPGQDQRGTTAPDTGR
ncbi:hypothetical protein ACPXCE_23035 [Streptomyces sp. DT24]|uniref:hypothetical protein n=1 Tax=Streptomyces sp. DT24 TaxID=3416520 RepID=UPI003CEB7891